MENIFVGDNLRLSRIVLGHWRLADWGLSVKEILKYTHQAIEIGINSFDNADIYGNYSCEKLFGDAISQHLSLRKEIKIITKCGLKLLSNKFPDRKIKTYDLSYNHIINSAEKSLSNFNTDYLDLLLLHRPSHLLNPEEVSRAFDDLKQSGKVLNFGVSNFSKEQFVTLDSYLNHKLVTNQVEISASYLEHFDNGNMDYFLKSNISPMAWSPLVRGEIFNPETEKDKRILNVTSDIAKELDEHSIAKVLIAWLLKHPANILPIIGTGKIDRLKIICEAEILKITDEQWFRIYNASKGKELD